jgi:hypothetical protein
LQFCCNLVVVVVVVVELLFKVVEWEGNIDWVAVELKKAVLSRAERVA